MSDYARNPNMAAALAATAIVSLAIGFGAASWIASGKETNGPIINPTAWEETAPTPQVHTVALTNTAKPATIASAAKCNPWEISDAAMEEVLDEMINRGWRPPNQGDAIAAMGVSSIAATDPNAPMPYRRSWAPLDPNAVDAEAVSTDPTVPAPNDPAGGAPQPAAIEQPAAPAPADS